MRCVAFGLACGVWNVAWIVVSGMGMKCGLWHLSWHVTCHVLFGVHVACHEVCGIWHGMRCGKWCSI